MIERPLSGLTNQLGHCLAGGFSFLRLSTGSRVILPSLDAQRHIAALTKIAATMHQDDRKRMFAAAKLTVRAYAKDPSDNNAARVHVAWKAVNDLKARSFLRQWQEARRPEPADGKPRH